MNLKELHYSIADTGCRLPYSYDPSQPFEPQRARAEKKFLELLGMPEKKGEVGVKVEFVNDSDPRFTETRFAFESEPGFFVPCHMLMPKAASAKSRGGLLPVMICIQGHSTGMHISIGRAKFEGDEETIAGGRDFAIQAVERGYLAIAMEQRGLGELRHGSCLLPASQALLIGRTLLGERIFDVSRLIDALSLPLGGDFASADTGRIYVMGNSGGGTTSWHAAAVEHRLAGAMPSCAFNTYRKSIFAMDHCFCNHIPRIMEFMEMPDLAMLSAPTPVVIVAGKKDSIFPIDGVLEGFDTVKQIYKAAGVPDACALVAGEEGHQFYPDIAWPVFDEMTGN
ncbi:MAG: acetylxylan esterase [Clostridiales bacterium]|jgi:dienelactone hydrolase|nr:acetylxylan esterase [Clostridiales bacterium]